MTDFDKVLKAIIRIAAGYVLILVDVFVSTVNIVPDWLGYVLIFSALGGIALEEPSAKLLKPFAAILAAWSVLEWNASLLEQIPFTESAAVIIRMISVYFFFQLYTNLAAIANKYGCPQEKSLLKLRTVQTVLMTLISVLSAFSGVFSGQEYVILAFSVSYVLVAIAIAVVLFGLKKSLTPCAE